jgi:hypothetical protein
MCSVRQDEQRLPATVIYTTIMLRQRVVRATAQKKDSVTGTDMAFIDRLEITNTLIIFALLYRLDSSRS